MADPATLAGVFSGLGGFLGNIFSGKDRREAEELLRKVLANYESIEVPTLDQQSLSLDPYQYAGDFTANLEDAVTLGPSAFEDISLDPRLEEAQYKALGELEELGRGDLRMSDKAALNRVLTDVGAADRGRREAILQNMDARGMGGSGFELAAQLQGAQDASQNAAQSSMDLLGSVEDRALEALMGAGDMATGMRTQQYGEQSDKAKARDYIDQFNAQNRQQVQGRNVDRTNLEGRTNLDNRQNWMNQNTDLRNQEQVHNKGLYQDQFNNRMSKAQAVAGASGALADHKMDRADSTSKMFTGIGQGIGKTIYKPPTSKYLRRG